MKYIIMADGKGTRWNNFNNIPKHFIEINGEKIIFRTVRLLNETGVEDSPISAWTYDAVDYGFGRKVGFHSFRSHPLFDGMNGGAYVWHGHNDNKCRVLGFPKGVTPSADGTKVIGIFWEYIYYHPDEKVIWETPYGKGNILSVGGMLNYGAPNYNRCLLERFTRNCVEYLAGTLKSAETPRYWDYSERPETSEDGYEYDRMDISGPTRWTLPEDSHALSWKATGNEVNIAGRRTTVICKENGGIFGGEDNGGLIFPEHQYCRDGAMGMASILEIIAKEGDLDDLVSRIPKYHSLKITVKCPDAKKAMVAEKVAQVAEGDVTTADGIRIDYDDGWVLIRASGTEPKFRIYSESSDERLMRERSEHYRTLIEGFIDG